MKHYCFEENCPNKIKGYAICTALEDVKDCPKRKTEDARKEDIRSKEESNER